MPALNLTERRLAARPFDQMRKVTLTRDVMKNAHGSCLAEFGDTHVMCTATIEEAVPAWRRASRKGWVTAEYAMLPASTNTRTKREYKGRKGSITGGWVALHDALMHFVEAGKMKRLPLTGQVAAISAGIVAGTPMLDLDYPEDSHADVALNLVGTGDGGIVEIQGTGEHSTLSRAQLNDLLDMGEAGVARLCALQDEVTGFTA